MVSKANIVCPRGKRGPKFQMDRPHDMQRAWSAFRDLVRELVGLESRQMCLQYVEN